MNAIPIPYLHVMACFTPFLSPPYKFGATTSDLYIFRCRNFLTGITSVPFLFGIFRKLPVLYGVSSDSFEQAPRMYAARSPLSPQQRIRPNGLSIRATIFYDFIFAHLSAMRRLSPSSIPNPENDFPDSTPRWYGVLPFGSAHLPRVHSLRRLP